MELNDYQEKAHETSFHEMSVIYPTLGLLGEAGEVAEKIKKLIRDKGYRPGDCINDNDKKAITLELGDVMWYVAELASNLDLSLETICQQNLIKLSSRKSRNKLHGSGDFR